MGGVCGDRAAHDQAWVERDTRASQRNGWEVRGKDAIQNQAGWEHADRATLRKVRQQAETGPGGCEGPDCQEDVGAAAQARNR